MRCIPIATNQIERAERVVLERCCWVGHDALQPSSQPSSTPHLLRPRYTECMCFSGSFSGFKQQDTQFSYWLQHWSSAPQLRAGWGRLVENGWGGAEAAALQRMPCALSVVNYSKLSRHGQAAAERPGSSCPAASKPCLQLRTHVSHECSAPEVQHPVP